MKSKGEAAFSFSDLTNGVREDIKCVFPCCRTSVCLETGINQERCTAAVADDVMLWRWTGIDDD